MSWLSGSLIFKASPEGLLWRGKRNERRLRYGWYSVDLQGRSGLRSLSGEKNMSVAARLRAILRAEHATHIRWWPGTGNWRSPCLFKSVMRCFMHSQKWNRTIDDLQDYPHPDWYISAKQDIQRLEFLRRCPRGRRGEMKSTVSDRIRICYDA